MFSPLEEIKSRIDLVELISSYTRLQKAGVNYRANCPFHAEKTPSFFVSPARQIWHCFGCSRGGDHFKFIMETEGCDFPEALKLLAQRAGVALKREDPRMRSEKNRLYEICEEAAKIFERNLALTPAAKKYMQKRGVKEETIKEFRVGFAPKSWDFLLKTLRQKGFKNEEAEKAGLAVKSEDKDSRYDRFRSRIMFPVSDANGRVVGFSGRIFDAEEGNRKPEVAVAEAKYINTPNTQIYDKSRILYGFDKAKHEIRSKNRTIVVEGQMDCIMSHQAGARNAVAVSGTALSPHQLKILRRLCDTMIFSFDTDAAGESATKRSLKLAAEQDFERLIADIPAGKDPADAVAAGLEIWLEAVEKARPVAEFYFAKAVSENDSRSAEGRKKIAAEFLPLVAEFSNEIEKAHWVGKAARVLALPEEAVWRELKRVAEKSKKSAEGFREASEAPEETNARFSNSRRHLLEERLLALFAALRENAVEGLLENRNVVFAASVHQELFVVMRNGAAGIDAFPREMRERFELFKFKGELIAQTVENMREEFSLCARELEKELLKESLQNLRLDIERKEVAGDKDAAVKLLEEVKNISQKLKSLS